MQRERNDRRIGRGAVRAVVGGGIVLAMVAGVPWLPDVAPARARALEPGQDDSTVQVMRMARRGGGGRVGLSVTDVENGSGEEGAQVSRITPHGPASDAGFEVGDVVVEFDGERVRSARQLSRLVDETPVGRTVPAVVMRDGSSVELEVTLESGRDRVVSLWERHDNPVPPPAGRLRVHPAIPEGLDFGWNMDDLDVPIPPRGRRLGIQGMDLGEQLAAYFSVEDGVLVASVDEESASASAGLQAGDVITEIDGEPVGSVASLRRRIRSVDRGETFTIGVMRDGSSMELEGRFPMPRRSPGVGLGI